jgi:hypothetical protein
LQEELFTQPFPKIWKIEGLMAFSHLIKSLKKGRTIERDGVSIIQLDTAIPEIRKEPNTQVYVRSFYPELFAQVRQNQSVIVIGNPGIGKSCFQW